MGEPGVASNDVSVTASEGARPLIAFVYSARDVVWPGMGRALFAQSGAARAALVRCERLILKRLGSSLEAASSQKEPAPEHMREAVLTACQIALTDAWRERGVEPEAIVARCGGEFTAAYAQRALTLEDAVEMSCRIGMSIREGRGAGRMLALRCTMTEAEHLQRGSGRPFWPAGEEKLDLTIVACATEHASEIAAFLTANGVENWQVQAAIAPHSPIVEEWRAEMWQPLTGGAPAAHHGPYYSAAAPDALATDELGLAHFWRAVREPALFRRAVDRAIADGYRIFVEVGGHPTLAGVIGERGNAVGAQVLALPTMRREEPPIAVMDETEAALASIGAVGSGAGPASAP
jgi:acyl transferase domain-containing protein